MKVVHTFFEKNKIIWKELIYCQYLSALLAKKHYGNISFYGDDYACSQVEKIGIPYDNINSDVLKNVDPTTWSVPKIKVYESMNEPFLHIDTDTFLFSKIEFDTYKQDYMFSHKDMFVPGENNEKLLKNLYQYWFCNIEINNIDYGKKYPFKTFVENFQQQVPNILLQGMSGYKEYYYLNKTYTNLFFDLMENIGEEIFDDIHFSSIPNMNILYVKNHEKFADVCKSTLKHYEENKEKIDSEKFGSCYIEQLMLHTHLRMVDKKYKKSSEKHKNFIFEESPLVQMDSHNNVPSVDDVIFPLKFRLLNQKHFSCPCCNNDIITSLSTRNLDFKEISIESIEDIKNYFDYNFNGFLHVTYLKWYDVIQAIIIDKLRAIVGDDEIRKIHHYFLDKYPQLNLPILSGGEKLYTKLTGFKFTQGKNLS